MKQKVAEIGLPANAWAAKLKERKDYHGLAAVFSDNSSYQDSGDWNRRMDAARLALREAQVEAISSMEDVQQSFSGRSDYLKSLLDEIRRDLK